MFGFIKKFCFTGLALLSTLTRVDALSCISMNNQECKVRPQIVSVNSEPVFYPFSIKKSKCSGSCNNINDPYAKMCVPDFVKLFNVKAFNLMLRTNETSHIKWHETCKCKCRLDASLCNNKQHWNDDISRCECKELIDKGVCDKGFIWNPRNCECECDKLCDVGEYVDYENCKCREKLVDKLIEKCIENIEEVKIAGCNSIENTNKCSSCALYIVFFSILLPINVGIGTYFGHFYWYSKKDDTGIKFGTHTQTTIWLLNL